MAAFLAAALLALAAAPGAAATSRQLMGITNLQYLKAPAPHTNLTHGGAAAIIIAVCLFPFMCICLIWAYLYAKRTAAIEASNTVPAKVAAPEAPVEETPAASP